MKLASTLLAGLMILAAPWPIGGNFLYVRTVVLVLTAILGIMAALSCLVERRHFSTSILWLVLPLSAAYVVFQTLDLSGPISIYPSVTKAQLYVLASAIGIFLSSIILFRDTKTIEPLLVCASVVGFAVAFVGVIQNLGGNGKILWVYELLFGGVPFGPFVNANNGAGFLILVVAGPFYFLSKQFLTRDKDESQFQLDDMVLNSGSSGSSKRSRKKGFTPLRTFAKFLANLQVRHLYCLTALIAIVAGVFLTLSRGGSVSIVVGLSAGMLILMIANRWAVILAAIVIVACIGAATWIEQVEAVSQSLATIADADSNTTPRLLHWRDALPYYESYWQFGSGLGTYRYEYPVFQEQQFQGKFAHAENVYLEALAELGIGGVVALLLSVFVLFFSCIRLFRQPMVSDRALGVAGFVALVGLASASCLDFGIYQPANFIVASILFGAIVGRASHPDCAPKKSKKGKVIGQYFQLSMLILLILACGYSVIPSAALESVQLAKRQVALHTAHGGESIHRLDRAEKSLLFAEKFLPENWEVQYLLGQCQIFRHRQALTDQVRAETEDAIRQQAIDAGLSEEEVEDAIPARSDFWTTTSMINLHRVMRMVEVQNPQEFASMRADPTVVTPELQKAWEHFHESLSRCDRVERVHFRLAQLTVLLGPVEGNRAAESAHVANALALAKGYTGLLFDAGLLCMHSGNFEQSAELWANCLSRSRQYERRIVRFGVGLPGKLYFEKVLPQNPDNMLRLSKKYFSTPDQKVPNELLLVHTRRLIKSSKLDDVQKSVLNGRAWFQAKNFQNACEEFERVLSTKPDSPPWRMDYAISLGEIGRFDDAIKELTSCQLEQPASAIKISRLVESMKRERLRQRTSDRE